MRNTNDYLTNNHTYECEYCHKEYVPKRRFAQKYCSNSCRSKAYHQRNKNKIQEKKPPKIKKDKSKKREKTKIDKMSFAGAGNAAAGTLAADLLTKVFTPKQNQPATKGDIDLLLNKLQRYHRILNMESKPDGRLPYFDHETKMVIYF